MNILKVALKKCCLSKTTSTNFWTKQDFKDEVLRSYLKFIVKYVRGGEKRDTLFGDALGGIDDHLYYIHKNLRLEGQTYAMTVDNFWRLCYDAHVNLKYYVLIFLIYNMDFNSVVLSNTINLVFNLKSKKISTDYMYN